MTYLYGDSTPSELASNFLEFLRDGIDFAVFALEADAGIERGKVRIQKNTDAMEAEIGRIEHFISVVRRSILEAEKGAVDSPTAACATYLGKLVAEAERASVAAMRTRLAQYIAGVDAEETASRTACFKALGNLLAAHDPPDAETVTRLVLQPSGHYDGTLSGRSAIGLAWTFALGTAEGTMWSTPVPIERVAQNLEIRAPQLSGWISKEVKVRPQSLDRHVVTELVLESDIVRMKLRQEPGVDAGFDFVVTLASKTVEATRIGPSGGDASVGTFDVVADDAALIVDLAEKLRAAAAGITRRELTAATWREGDFRNVPTFGEIVEELVAMMAPITREIAKRSLKPTELVLRRMLGNDRREELFVERATLRRKYETLSPPLRAFFAPLGFDSPAEPSATGDPTAVGSSPEAEAPSVARDLMARAEIARSQPPEPLRSSAPPLDLSAPALPEWLEAAASPIPAETATAERTAPMPFDPSPSEPPPDSGPAVEITSPEASTPPEPLPASTPPPETSQNPRTKVDQEGTTKNVELIAALKKIVSLSRTGRIDEAYSEYAALFSSTAFGEYRHEEQRQALKLMVLAKNPPPKSEVVVKAHRAALARLEVLTETGDEAIDFEMLEAAQEMCDEPNSA